MIGEFSSEAPTLAILKHTNPCGVGQGATLHEAWDKAFATDRQAPFGGIIAVNRSLDLACAQAIAEIFSEVIVAPGFTAEALGVLQKKKNLRLLRILQPLSAAQPRELRSVGADSFLWQERDAKVKELRNRVERLTNGTDYATQRPHPEQSEFLRAFGQPKRESPCACERSSEPTIDQELQLLNGKAVADRLAAAADAYASLADDALADELYLTAFARRPTPAERATVREHLARADRREAVRDIVWVVVNTQEFLFQH